MLDFSIFADADIYFQYLRMLEIMQVCGPPLGEKKNVIKDMKWLLWQTNMEISD